MSQTIDLHGGPWHGRTVELPDGQDHFHIVGPMDLPVDYTAESADMEIGQVHTREGMYSRVCRSRNFEWDGWLSHD
jgi:hypothetical protein